MPLTLDIYDPPGVILVSVAGTLHTGDQLDYLRWMADEHRLRPGMKEIIDLRGIDEMQVSSSHQAGYGYAFKMHAQIQANLVSSVIIAPTDLTFGMARVYQQAGSTEDLPIHIVQSAAEAIETLGLPQDFLLIIDDAMRDLCADSETLMPLVEPELKKPSRH